MQRLHESAVDDTADSSEGVVQGGPACYPWLVQEWPRPDLHKPFFERAS